MNDTNKVRSSISRRGLLLSSAVGLGALAMPSVVRGAQSLTVRDPGGNYTAAFTDALYAPFKKETGVEIVAVSSSPDPTAQLKSIVDTKNYIWDLALIGGAAHDVLVAENCLEVLGLEDDENIKLMSPNFRSPYIVGEEIYAAVLAYRTDLFKEVAPVGGWKDMWDTKRFPGRRALRKHPFDTFEIALLADGVAPANLYPIDSRRALRSLDRIKPDINVWWSSGAECTQLLISKDVDLMSTWAAAPRRAIEAGAPIAISWEQGLYQLSGWVIPRGNPKADLARRFISFASRPDRQAAFAPILGSGITNPLAYKLIDDRVAKTLPTYPQNFEKLIRVDTKALSVAKDQLSEQFLEWVVK